MRFAAIALVLTSTVAKDMKELLSKMTPKDLEAMAKHFQAAADAKSLQATPLPGPIDYKE